MSGGDEIAAEGTAAQFAERLRDEYDIDLGQQFTDGYDSLDDVIENAQHDRITEQDGGQAQGSRGERDDELSTGQTIHDEYDWLGKPVTAAGQMIGGEFVAMSDWSGGIIEDDELPPEHKVYTEGEQPKGEEADSWVIPGDDAGYGEGYDSGYDDGYNEGYDQAAEEWGGESDDSWA
jgi:hypothetical protein